MSNQDIITKGKMENWRDHEFESSCSTTPEFAAFARDFKKELNRNKGTLDLVNFSRGHFYVSGFLQNRVTHNLVYFSISDVRFFPEDWYNHILIRTAQHDKDYTGGRNFYTTWQELPATALHLT